MKNLSRVQLEILRKMRNGEAYNGYRLRASMSTLYALLRRSLIERSDPEELVLFGNERVDLHFVITEYGRQAIVEA